MALTSIQPDARFQDSVIESELMNPTNSAGSPAAGSFYTQILNRKPMVDFRKDLRANMGLNRIPLQNAIAMPDECGPNGEAVWGVPNDTYNQIRLVGPNWSYINNNSGVFASSAVAGDFLEVTFYGTGLNLLLVLATGSDFRVSVDGGAEGANIAPANSQLLSGRNNAPNTIVPAITGLTPGVHTVKIRHATAGVFFLNINAVEIVNDAATLTVQPGYAQSGNRKNYLASQQAIPYASSFDSGVLGIRGGRVVTYLKKDNTIGKSVQPTDASSALSTSASHANEEIARIYNTLEFGASRTDNTDFSNYAAASSNRSYTLDDGSTTLTAGFTSTSSTSSVASLVANRPIGVYVGAVGVAATGGYIQLTFVGTGLDVMLYDSANGGADQNTFQVDGGAATNMPYSSGSTALRQVKIVSGLPYGTHTFRFNKATTVNTFSTVFCQFIVYQPKKPAIPVGAVELADYNVMATFAPNTTLSNMNISTGVLRKCVMRETVLVNGTGGTTDWTLGGTPIQGVYMAGFECVSDRTNSQARFTFWGTGFDLRGYADNVNTSTNITVSINGLTATTTNFPTMLTSTAGYAFNSGTGVLNQSNALDSQGKSLCVYNLPLGLYTVVFNNNTTVSHRYEAFDIITPVHSHKSLTNTVAQNTVNVGSQGIGDSRKTTAIKEIVNQTKNITQAYGVTSGPSTSSTSPVPIPDMSLVHLSKTGRIKVTYNITARSQASALGAQQVYKIYIDGITQPTLAVVNSIGANGAVMTAEVQYFTVAPGHHKVDVYWNVSSSSILGEGIQRSLLVEDV